jgi:hypothetical protein
MNPSLHSKQNKTDLKISRETNHGVIYYEDELTDRRSFGIYRVIECVLTLR